jgi:phage tail tape-measure protein
MARIVAGVFEDEQAATAVARELRGAGFEAGDLDQFALNPPGRNQGLSLGGDEIADAKAEGGDAGAVKGAAIGSAVGAVAGLAATPLIGPIAIAGGAAAGAYAGSLAGAVKKMGDDRPAPETRPAGVMVAVNAEASEDEECAIDLLREHHPRMIERADGVWRNGKWADFDPVRPPDVVESHVAGDSAPHRPAGGGAP